MSRLIAFLLLAACAQAPAQQGYRAAKAPIYSSAVLETARLNGRWVQVAAYRPASLAPCPAPGITVTPQSGGSLAVSGQLCAPALQKLNTVLRPGGPGRFAATGAVPAGLDAPWWVLWVDTDYRTVLIGSPDGRFGFVLNRTPTLPDDRRRAVLELLDWNGYDPARLTFLTPR
jgi:apolipoprotein D and lipocalin family protein